MRSGAKSKRVCVLLRVVWPLRHELKRTRKEKKKEKKRKEILKLSGREEKPSSAGM